MDPATLIHSFGLDVFPQWKHTLRCFLSRDIDVFRGEQKKDLYQRCMIAFKNDFIHSQALKQNLIFAN